MNRYSTTKISNRWDGKRVYNTTKYPTIIKDDGDIIIVSNEGDYLDSLAQKYYGDKSLWWVIALANGLGKGKLSVEPGLKLLIPINIPKILSNVAKLNG